MAGCPGYALCFAGYPGTFQYRTGEDLFGKGKNARNHSKTDQLLIALEMFNSFRKNLYRFFNKEDAAESSEMQPILNKRLFEILPQFKNDKTTESGIEYFFYTDEEEKANDLAIELKKLGYEIYEISPPYEKTGQWSITGCTHTVEFNEEELTKWSEQMVQLGYDNDCKFDGWGTLL